MNASPDPSRQAKSDPSGRRRRRRELFLAAALGAFLRDGYEGMSLKSVVDAAGGSLATLYEMFGSKQLLFEAVIARQFDMVYGSARTFELAGLSPEEALTKVGHGVLDMALSDNAIGVVRLMAAEGQRMPHLRQSFMRIAPERGIDALADYLSAEVAAGRLVIADCRLAAAQFLGMVEGYVLLRRLLGEEVRLAPGERDTLVRSSVALFLDGCRRRRGGTGT